MSKPSAKPMISVIMPVYQGEKTLERAIASVLGQTTTDFELLVVDDGSTDRTPEILNRLQKTLNDPRMRVWVQTNRGTGAARNWALSQAQGDYIAFLDSDDLWFPDKLAWDMVTFRSVPEPYAMVYSPYYAVNQKEQLTHWSSDYRFRGAIFSEMLCRTAFMLPSTVTIHRALYEALGGFHEDHALEDREFFLRLAKHFPAYPTGKRTVIYRQSEQGKCRHLLVNYDRALFEELVSVQALQNFLTDQEQQLFRHVQLENLVYRFLMYGQLRHAQRLAQQLGTDMRWQGKKGLLAKWSLKTGFNWMAHTRKAIQATVQTLSGPWWGRQMRTFQLPTGGEAHYAHL